MITEALLGQNLSRHLAQSAPDRFQPIEMFGLHEYRTQASDVGVLVRP